jgi:hypothetical protein
MKHLKTFISLFENDDLGHSAREIFDVWEVYKLRGPGIRHISDEHLKEIDWERGDYLDSPDSHVKVYSAEGFDKSGLEFQAEYMEIDGHIIELDLDNLEIANSESLDQTIYDKIESNGHIVKRTKKFNTLETSAELEDIIKTFKGASTDYLPKDGMMVVDGKEYEVDLMLNWPIAKLSDDTKEYWRIPKTSILYIKSKQGEEIWAIYDR